MATMFEGLGAKAVSILSRGRVEVVLDIMGNITRVKMQTTDLQRLEAAE